MRRHAKAATAGSTQRRAKSLGGVTLAVIGALALAALAIVPSGAAAAAPEAFWTRCASNSEGDASCSLPRGIASSPVNGDVYVGDQANSRIVQFSPWGVFLRTWGWDVVQSGPDNNGAGFEICVPASGDVCKAGSEGDGAGQFGAFAGPQGVAVDSAGDVYVLDRGLPSNNRVQKFDSEGHFLRMFGGEVNSGTSGNPNICTNAGAPTDVCKAGSTGTANGQFGELSVVGSYIAIDTAATATASDDKVYVGDQERIQSFNAAGEYQSQIAQPGERVKGLAVDPAGNLYVSFCGTGCGGSIAAKANVRKLSSAGTELGTVTVANPQALATDSAGDLYVVDGATIREFTPAGSEVPAFAFQDGISSGSTGIATGSACLSAGHDLYVSNTEVPPIGFVRAYGPVPDEAHVGLCPPPPHAPEILEQATLSVEATAATLQASINPKFWADTSYYVQYATAACIEAEGWAAPCVTQVPASPAQLGAGVSANPTKTAKLPLTGLSPGTEYLYRFAAESSGGGPVFGKGGTEAQDGKASLFTTPAPLGPPSGNCANAAFRIGPSAALPDCRAYEMVSPVDKNGGDIGGAGQEGYVQASSDGNRISYTVAPAFGDQPSSRFLNQYLATRQQGTGWSTHGINPPLAKQPLGITPIGLEVEAFSADLCSEWLVDFNSVPLVPQGQEGFANLYRQDLCGNGGFEALTVNPPAPGAAFEYVGSSSIQGLSADGNKVFFVAKAKLTADAAETNEKTQVYLYDRQSGVTRPVSVKRSGAADVGTLGTVGAALGGGLANFFGGNLQGAVSSDGSRAYWMSAVSFGDTVGNKGTLFLRENPAQPPSALEHGGATGKGDLSRTHALALVTESTTEVLFFGASGEFSLGDPIEGTGIAPGTTIISVNEVGPGEGEMTISAPATENALTEIASASKTVTNLSTETGAFAPGQTIIGDGIAPETTVSAVNPGEGKLTLSKPVSLAFKGVKLEAFSECTEADKACTVPVSSGDETNFWGANPSGSEALYNEGRLENKKTNQATGTLYRFDAETKTSTLVAEHFRGVLGTSEDLSRIYFISTDVLTGSEKNAEGDQAQAEEPNLYLDEGGQLSFVATLLGGGFSGDVRPDAGTHPSSAYAIGSFNPLFNAARVSPDGTHIAFESRAPLTGYDNTDANNGEADVEVFTYEAGGELLCVSCRPSGERPSGRVLAAPFLNPQNQAFKTAAWGAAWIPTFENPLHASNVLSEDGSRLFFNANDALVPGDTNGTQDVYEWEAPGTGSCTSQSPAFHKTNGGCLYLISSGESPEESIFWEATPDGHDVFFTTEASLLPQDPGHVDLYNARVDGGFPQPPVPAACEGESCQSAPPPPTDPTLSSASFRGEGNPKGASGKPRCAKGKRKVRRAGKVRCVPRKAQHANKKRQKRTANHNRRTAR